MLKNLSIFLFATMSLIANGVVTELSCVRADPCTKAVCGRMKPTYACNAGDGPDGSGNAIDPMDCARGAPCSLCKDCGNQRKCIERCETWNDAHDPNYVDCSQVCVSIHPFINTCICI